MKRERTFFGDTTKAQHEAYLEFIKREFYEGELTASAHPNFVLTAEKLLTHPIGLIRMISNTDISYRRTQKHIRGNRAGFHVLWFVAKGIVELVRSHSTYEIREGEWGISDSSVPFHAKTLTENGEFEVLYAVVPAHLYLSHLSVAGNLEGPVSLDCLDSCIVHEQLRFLTELGKTLAPRVAEKVVASLLEALADQVRHVVDCSSSRDRIANGRIDAILQYVEEHASELTLTHSSVATANGISSRYLSHLLKIADTSFSKLLWGRRLVLAHDCLLSEGNEASPLRDIAHCAGFKSVAHLVRTFKAKFGMTPMAYRAFHLKNKEKEV